MDLACDVCGRAFTARRGARYCSGQCRTLAYRQRQGQAAGKPVPRRPPITDAFDKATQDLLQRAERLARLAGDDRVPRHREVLKARNGYDLARTIEHLQATLDTLGWGKPD